MSVLGAIELALLGIVETKVPGTKSQAGPIVHDDIPPGDFPFAYTQGFEITPQLDDPGQVLDVITGELVLVTDDHTHDQVMTFADSIRSGVMADATLGGLISAETLVGLATSEIAGKKRRVVVFSFEGRTTGAVVASGDLISYALVLVVDLKDATPDEVTYLGTVNSNLVALLSTAVRDEHDLGDPTSLIEGETSYQLATFVSSLLQGSNITNRRMALQLRVHHALAAGETERSYTNGVTAPGMLAVTPTLMTPGFWEAGFDTTKVVDLPELSFPSDLTRT